MTTTQTDIFEILASTVDEDPGAMLQQLVEHFRKTRSPMEMFEAQKMQIRHQLGLPLIASDEDPPRAEEVERQLESGLLDACREAGSMLITDGNIAEGWMYLRPLGDKVLAKKLFDSIEITEQNYDEMVQVLLHEGVDVGRGYQAVLDHQGTCNSITLYEQAIVGRGEQDRAAAAARLLEHFYDELSSVVRNDIAQHESPAGDDETLYDMIQKRRWILEDGGYHLDTTHIAATVRIASILRDPGQLRKAWELTQYGRRLHHQFQYPGEEPFVDFYPAYATFYGVLLDENVDAGLKMFQRKAQTVDVAQHGVDAIETYVDLLDRVGRHVQAIEAATEMVPDDLPAQRIVPRLIAIARSAKANGDDSATQPILAYCRNHNDILGYAAALESRHRDS